MGDSKGKAWIGKIYNKLEKILVEVDTFTSQSTLCLKSRNPSGWESVRSEPEDSSSGSSNMQRHYDPVASPSSERPFDPPLQQNFEVLGNVRVGERVEEDGWNESLLSVSSSPDGEMLPSGAPLVEDYCRCNLTLATTRSDDEPIITDEETRISNPSTPQGRDASVYSSEESVEEVRIESCKDVGSSESQCTHDSVESFGRVVDSQCNGDPVLTAVGISTNNLNLNPIATKIPDGPENVAYTRSSNEDDVTDGKSDGTPLNTNALYSMAFQEDPLCVDDNALYAVRVRTKKLRSFKRKVLDALNAKRRREEEYEHLAIWFGDADMGSDLETEEAIDLKQEESQWELL